MLRKANQELHAGALVLVPRVQAVVAAYLDAVDAAVPGLVEGLYLVGSVALGDVRPRSDVDFVAVTAAPPAPQHRQALRDVHARIGARRPYFDGIYVTWSGLAGDPAALNDCPSVHEGEFVAAGPGDIIAWHTLARHGLACRGPAVETLDIWTDAQALAAWCDNNLEAYWRQRMLEPCSRLLSRAGVVALGAWFCEWCVTGVSRLHYTLATGRIASKHDAACYALQAFSERWSRVIGEALRIRRGGRRSLYRSKLRRRRDVLAFMRMAIANGHRIYREPAGG